MTRSDIQSELKKILDKKRYEHTLGVAYTCAALAMRYGINMEDALMAGLLHDCAKYMSDKEYIAYCQKHNIEMKDVEIANPALLHAKVGAYMARHKYGIDNDLICSAILYHTTGRPEMTDLETILFVADYIEPNRTHDPELNIIREEAFLDIKKCVGHIYINTMNHLGGSNKAVDPMTKEASDYYNGNR